LSEIHHVLHLVPRGTFRAHCYAALKSASSKNFLPRLLLQV
jgi:hypothetical protein